MGDFKPLMPLRGKALIENSIDSMPPCDAFFLLPGDMPVVAKEMLPAVYRAMPEPGSVITFPTLVGYRKHPLLIDASFIPEILQYNRENGLRGFWMLNEDNIVTVAGDDVGCWTDLDTFAQYSRCVQRYQE